MEIEYANPDALSEQTAAIVCAYVSNNAIAAADLPSVIASVHQTLAQIGKGPVEPAPAEKLVPAVPIKKSVTDEFIICLEDGKQFKSLKRHLSSKFDMTPDEYRARWSLPSDYPMVAPGYSAKRSALALSLGLGRKAEVAAEPAEQTRPSRGRKAKAPVEA
ncbi:hypothetical protein Sa4125_11830 [Aureimonas sp. SA4125]|uniref:MucR family transcriptional regulator n=1 Tax=Aureimonas sp. SA4125 TaxID=2826993 RepID=UPI001CC767C3|nr:MucR family transcriptional regulator [Aureimonas sp. SA4125]BDA83641.1 hypothetical protein Sa4125_11830 [Aureimonas sp. SA4125]